ncbi:hypothetical protein C1H46_002400 [Malus baccata]|uniref:Uncharacterized protein n=1 Tax=Malus baccata TaxID=106549 RepID=A0A540NLV3_MALBA|nr:hypothetical protein C1H46_002400 [Malus baccata]
MGISNDIQLLLRLLSLERLLVALLLLQFQVMGTVRLRSDRDKQQKSKEENSKHNSRSRGVSTRLLSEGSGKDAKLGEPEGNLNREKASKVENRYESLGNRNRIAE